MHVLKWTIPYVLLLGFNVGISAVPMLDSDGNPLKDPPQDVYRQPVHNPVIPRTAPNDGNFVSAGSPPQAPPSIPPTFPAGHGGTRPGFPTGQVKFNHNQLPQSTTAGTAAHGLTGPGRIQPSPSYPQSMNTIPGNPSNLLQIPHNQTDLKELRSVLTQKTKNRTTRNSAGEVQKFLNTLFRRLKPHLPRLVNPNAIVVTTREILLEAISQSMIFQTSKQVRT